MIDIKLIGKLMALTLTENQSIAYFVDINSKL